MSAIKNFLITFCISILLFGLIAYLIMSFAMENSIIPILTGSVTDIPTASNAEDIDNNVSNTPNENENEEYSEALAMEVNTMTVLLIGTDYQPEVFDDYDLTETNKDIKGFPHKERTINADTILMVHINNDSKKFMISAIPSKMSLLIDGVYTTLGTLYSEKGIEFLCGKVTAVTGMYIDYYAVIALDDFAKIIDELGGVSFNVPTDMVYEDPTQDLEISLSKGEQTLNGAKAVKMLRYRSYSDGDISRMSVTVNFMENLLSKLSSVDYISKAVTLYMKFIEMIETNFTETSLAANIDSILAYSVFEKDIINYPGTSDGEIFEPNISTAIATYKKYK